MKTDDLNSASQHTPGADAKRLAQGPVAFDKRGADLLVFLLPALALTTPIGLPLIQVCFIVVLSWYGRQATFAFFRRHWSTLGAYVFGCVGYFLISVVRCFVDGQNLSSLDGPFRILLSLSAIAFVGVCRPSRQPWWIGVCLGALGAGIVAILETSFYAYTVGFWFDFARAEGFTHHPISFGSLALAMAMLSVCALPVLRQGRLVALPWIGLLFGMFGSLLSVSRGAWIALIFCMIPLLRWRTAMQRRTNLFAVLGIALFCLAAYAVPSTGVSSRVHEGWKELRMYVDTGKADTKVGIRLDLWKASALMIAQHPWLGVGRDQFYPRLQELAQEKKIQLTPHPIFNSSSHNDILYFWSTGGLLDLSTYVLMLGAPWIVYLRRLRSSGPDARAIAMAGLMLVLCFFAFGLTDAMFWLMIPKTMYVMFNGILLGFCCTNAADETPNVSGPSALGAR